MKSKKKTTNKQVKVKNGSFSKRQFFIIMAIILTFGALGVYMLNRSSAYTAYYASYLNNDQARLCIQQPPSDIPPTQGVGSRGPCVYAIQVGLNNWTTAQTKAGNSKNSPTVGGYVAVDGIYGESTKQKVIAFQKAKGAAGKNTAPDGVVGPNTWTAFFNDCSVFNMCPVPNPSGDK